MDVDAGEAIAQVVRGKSVEVVISGLTRTEIKEHDVHAVPGKRDEEAFHLRESIRKYEDIINEMKTHQDFLKNELLLRDNKIRELEEQIKRQRPMYTKNSKRKKQCRSGIWISSDCRTKYLRRTGKFQN